MIDPRNPEIAAGDLVVPRRSIVERPSSGGDLRAATGYDPRDTQDQGNRMAKTDTVTAALQ
jgi:hypothetical protein